MDAAAASSIAVVALDLTLYEIANVATRRWRLPEEAAEFIRLVLRICAETLVRVDALLLRDASEFAVRHDLTVYDAAYVAAARRRGWQLVSGDLKDLVEPGFAIAPDAVV